MPKGRWTKLLDDAVVEGPGWFTEVHGFDSLPLLVRPGSVLPRGAVDDRPDYDWADGVVLEAYEFEVGTSRTVTIPRPDGSAVAVEVSADGEGIRACSTDAGWSLKVGDVVAEARDGVAVVAWK